MSALLSQTPHPPPIRLPSVTALTDATTLASVLGPIRSITVSPRPNDTDSGARHAIVTITRPKGNVITCWLKTAFLAKYVPAQRTEDHIGREIEFLTSPAFAPAWRHMDSPYIAVAMDPIADYSRIGMLMHDLLPSGDVGANATTNASRVNTETERTAQEHTEIATLATLHATFWNDTALNAPWLNSAENLLEMTGPRTLFNEERLGPPTRRDPILSGWDLALCYLPWPVRHFLLQPVSTILNAWGPLPRTLLHGCPARRHFMRRPTHGIQSQSTDTPKVTALDWSYVAVGPPTIDLGCYLACNASTLVTPKDTLIQHYRTTLEHERGVALPESQWNALHSIGIVAGTLCTMWQKALDLETDAAATSHEWAWWAERLSACCPTTRG